MDEGVISGDHEKINTDIQELQKLRHWDIERAPLDDDGDYLALRDAGLTDAEIAEIGGLEMHLLE